MSESTNLNWPNWIEQTAQIENQIWERQELVEEEFCHGGELLKVRLSSHEFEVIYLISDGATIVDGFPIQRFIDFLGQYPLGDPKHG